MGIGAALSEEFLIDPDTGRVFNANLLDYKVPTFMDTPVIRAAFVETREPSSGYGNKALGNRPSSPRLRPSEMPCWMPQALRSTACPSPPKCCLRPLPGTA